MTPPPVLLVDLHGPLPRIRPGRGSATPVRVQGDHVTVAFSGELDRANLDLLEARLGALDGAGPARLTLDLGRVTFVDVAATRGLLAWARRTTDRGVAVHLAHPPRLLASMATLLGYDVQVALAT